MLPNESGSFPKTQVQMEGSPLIISLKSFDTLVDVPNHPI